jgi:hypothetical protein
VEFYLDPVTSTARVVCRSGHPEGAAERLELSSVLPCELGANLFEAPDGLLGVETFAAAEADFGGDLEDGRVAAPTEELLDGL